MIFTHTSRPSEVPEKYQAQHWFLSHHGLSPCRRLSSSSGQGNFLNLIRHTDYCPSVAELQFCMPAGSVCISLTSAELLELARMCVDAAADVEQNP